MIQTIANQLRLVAQTVVKHIRQMTRPANGSSTSNLIMGFTRSKHDLLVENALLRQQLIVLQRRQKRPQLSMRDRIKLICLVSTTTALKAVEQNMDRVLAPDGGVDDSDGLAAVWLVAKLTRQGATRASEPVEAGQFRAAA